MQHNARATMRHRLWRLFRRWLNVGLLGLALAGCAQHGTTPLVASDTSTKTLAAERALQAWGARLAEHVSIAG